MDKSVKVLIGMVIAVIILFILNQVIGNKSVNVSNTDSYITINSEKIVSIYDKLGEKTITKVTDGTDKSGNYIEITYNGISVSEVASYITELGELDYVLTEANDNKVVVAKESSKEGMVLSVAINYSENSTVIKYARGSGTITRNQE